MSFGTWQTVLCLVFSSLGLNLNHLPSPKSSLRHLLFTFFRRPPFPLVADSISLARILRTPAKPEHLMKEKVMDWPPELYGTGGVYQGFASYGAAFSPNSKFIIHHSRLLGNAIVLLFFSLLQKPYFQTVFPVE